MCNTLLAPDPEDPASTTLELDELWSFVLKKAHDSWIWIALCRKTRQVVAYAVGDRSKWTCQRLWEAIPQGYQQGHCFTDFWAAYAAVIPEEQHSAGGSGLVEAIIDDALCIIGLAALLTRPHNYGCSISAAFLKIGCKHKCRIKLHKLSLEADLFCYQI